MELELEKLNLPSDNERPLAVITSVQECGNPVQNQAVSRVMAKKPCPG